MTDLEHFPTSTTAQRMMSRVSPIYDRSYVAKWLYQVMGLEWDQVREVMDSLWEQPFLEQATWGLRYWEQAYGLDTDETKSYAERRRLVAAKRSCRLPMNPARLETILSNLTGGTAVVTENIAPYTFSVELDACGNPIDYDAVIRLIRKLKPSHQSLRLYLISTAHVKVRPHIGKHRFPYRMTGEHPDINTIGGVERDRVLTGADGRGYSFPYPVTGPHLAGTIPEENTVGFQRGTGISAAAQGAGTVFPYAPAGELVAGTLPDTNTPGFIRATELEASASGAGTVFPYVQAGTTPDVNTTGIIQAVGVANAPDGGGAVFPYIAAGGQDAGTYPDIQVSGRLRNAAVQNAASGAGTVFLYPSTGDAEAGTHPDGQASGIVDGAAVSGMAAGSGTVIDYPLCGEDDE